MTIHRRIGDLGLLILPTLVGLLGAVPTVRSVRDWYPTLDRPAWTPPDRAFGPVWTTLYLLMGGALVLLRRAGPARGTEAAPDGAGADVPGDDLEGADVAAASRETDARVSSATRLFALQLGLNLAWSWIFFGARAIRTAGVEVVALWATILATIVAFWRVRPLAGMLLLPYLAWTTVATALNLSIWRRNA